MGERYIEADNGLGWALRADGMYVTEIFGVSYEMEKRRRSRVEPGSDTGWHLWSRPGTHFMGEFCDRTLLSAIDEASEMIAKADLRGEGYEEKE